MPPPSAPPEVPSSPGGRLLGLLALALLCACGEAEPLDGRPSSIHPAGFADDHRAPLRAAGWDPGPCYDCHTPDEGPGACRACHPDGADACDVCHAEPDPPHRAHLDFDCVTCHPVPAARATPGHIEDRPEDVRFTGRARGSDGIPTYAEGRCADTACHAGPGAASPTPAWGGPLNGGCGACHGMPPADHPRDRCDRCHGAVVDADGRIVEPALHLDGRVQAVDWRALPCDGCHGDGSAAPPPALDGRSDIDARGVGAHRAHLAPMAGAPVACETCHVVPARNDAPGHVDDDTPGAEVIFSGRAGEGARYRGGQCADTACHGPDRPSWTGDAPCGTCHGVPPAGHPAGDCARCHVVAAPGGGFAAPAEHVDGRLDVLDLGLDDCDRCHGAGGRVALGGSHGPHARYDCATCHRAVRVIAAHLDGDPAVDRPGWSAGTCADDSCHGDGRPEWGVPDSVSGCDACHGQPPPDHSVGDCLDCHPPADDPRHVDGRVDVTLPDGCESCHGQPDSGAHRAHAAPGSTAGADCADCHPVPEAVDAPGHLGPPPAEVVLRAGVYAEGRCADTTCHARPGAARPAPLWIDGRVRCGDCHAIPPPGHLIGPCDQCHSAVAEGYEIHDPARHADGRVDFR